MYLKIYAGTKYKNKTRQQTCGCWTLFQLLILNSMAVNSNLHGHCLALTWGSGEGKALTCFQNAWVLSRLRMTEGGNINIYRLLSEKERDNGSNASASIVPPWGGGGGGEEKWKWKYAFSNPPPSLMDPVYAQTTGPLGFSGEAFRRTAFQNSGVEKKKTIHSCHLTIDAQTCHLGQIPTK